MQPEFRKVPLYNPQMRFTTASLPSKARAGAAASDHHASTTLTAVTIKSYFPSKQARAVRYTMPFIATHCVSL